MQRVDVAIHAPSAHWPNGTAVVSGTIFADPSRVHARDAMTLVVAAPGGTYTRAYWNLEVPGRVGWSFAEHLVDDGFVVFAFDQPSTGDSSISSVPGELRFEDVAEVNASVAAQIEARARAGELMAGISVPGALRMIGVGHSLGGQLTAVPQSNHRSFDAVAILGSSFVGNAQVAPDAEASTVAEAHMRALAGDTYDTGLLRV